MDLSDLLKENRLKRVAPDEGQAKDCLEAAKNDIRTSTGLLGKDNDWALAIAYNSMLQSARALMFADGFRTVGEEHHKTIVDYADVKLGVKFAEKINAFDAMRKKRHHSVYDKRGVVSDYEAVLAVRTAEEFLSIVRKKLRL